MTLIGVKKHIAFYLINNIFSGTNPKTFSLKRRLLIWAGIQVGKGSKIVGPLRITGRLEIGENVWIGTGFTVHGNGNVKIRDNCDIAPDVIFATGSHEIGNKDRRAGKGKNSDITVGAGTWICTRSTVIGGVDIGNSCVIAAGSIVNKDVLDNSLVGGTPAKIIKILT